MNWNERIDEKILGTDMEEPEKRELVKNWEAIQNEMMENIFTTE